MSRRRRGSPLLPLILLDGRELPKYEAQIKRLPGKFVIDHTGKFLEPVAADHEAFKSFLRLVDTGRCWVKLSAPYETSKTGAPTYEKDSEVALMYAHLLEPPPAEE